MPRGGGGDQETGFASAAEGTAGACISPGGTHPLPFQSAGPLGSPSDKSGDILPVDSTPGSPKGEELLAIFRSSHFQSAQVVAGRLEAGENMRNLRLKRARGPWHQEEGLLQADAVSLAYVTISLSTPHRVCTNNNLE